jgi:hypothetical protein
MQNYVRANSGRGMPIERCKLQPILALWISQPTPSMGLKTLNTLCTSKRNLLLFSCQINDCQFGGLDGPDSGYFLPSCVLMCYPIGRDR